jgi:hypothetical protein
LAKNGIGASGMRAKTKLISKSGIHERSAQCMKSRYCMNSGEPAAGRSLPWP